MGAQAKASGTSSNDFSLQHTPSMRLIAHTLWSSYFSEAHFAYFWLGSLFSFSVNDLTIRATRQGDSRWYSGLICSIDCDRSGQKGLIQNFTHFEIRTKLPEGTSIRPELCSTYADGPSASVGISASMYGIFHVENCNIAFGIVATESLLHYVSIICFCNYHFLILRTDRQLFDLGRTKSMYVEISSLYPAIFIVIGRLNSWCWLGNQCYDFTCSDADRVNLVVLRQESILMLNTFKCYAYCLGN